MNEEQERHLELWQQRRAEETRAMSASSQREQHPGWCRLCGSWGYRYDEPGFCPCQDMVSREIMPMHDQRDVDAVAAEREQKQDELRDKWGQE